MPKLRFSLGPKEKVNLMPALVFKRPLLFLILEGRKTQTRRLKGCWEEGRIYAILDDYSEGPKAYIKITRKWKQRLIDMTEEDAKKEGFSSLAEFKAAWIKLYGAWQPETEIFAYEFQLIKTCYGAPEDLPRRNGQFQNPKRPPGAPKNLKLVHP